MSRSVTLTQADAHDYHEWACTMFTDLQRMLRGEVPTSENIKRHMTMVQDIMDITESAWSESEDEAEDEG